MRISLIFNVLVLVLLLMVLVPKRVFSQNDQNFVLVKQSGPKLQLANGQSKSAFYGGFNFPQFASIDLNFDGVEDLIALDKYGDNLEVFLGNGNTLEPEFLHAPYLNGFLPEITRKIITKDFDGDGKKDIFTNSVNGGGISVYKNVSRGGKLIFELYVDEINYYDHQINGNYNVFSGNEDQSAIVDMDYDGDLDILSFDNSGFSIYYHKNLSQEKYGHSDSFIYDLSADCWGSFDEYYSDTEEISRLKVTLNVNCGSFKKASGKHAGSNIFAKDFDNDGDFDAIISDSYYGNVVYLENGRINKGKIQTNIDSFIAYNDYFPQYDSTFYIDNYPSINEIDYNFDGIYDLVFAAGNREANIVLNQCFLYKNTGSNKLPNYKLVDTSFISAKGIEKWTFSQPAYYDIDADGDQDLFVVAPIPYSDYQTDKDFYKINLYKNIGDSTLPIYELFDDDFMEFSNLELPYFYLTFGDLNNDGATDMVLGKLKGKIFYYQNASKPGKPAVFELKKLKYQNVKVSQYVMPTVADVNGDNKNDLVLGDASGSLRCYLSNNDSLILYSEKWGGVQMGVPGSGFATPLIADFDMNGKNDLLITGRKGQIWFCRDFTYNESEFIIEKQLLFNDSLNNYLPNSYNQMLYPAAAELTNDSILDVVMGNRRGGLMFYKGDLLKSVSNEQVSSIKNLMVYPNPASGELNIKLNNAKLQSIKMYDLTGRLVFKSDNITGEKIDINGIKQGVYLLDVTTINKNHTYTTIVVN
ncbi:MAG: T9SS type A sorting domain-containing protein [Bacteroidia bacterium]